MQTLPCGDLELLFVRTKDRLNNHHCCVGFYQSAS